jgi:hypothetical protein
MSQNEKGDADFKKGRWKLLKSYLLLKRGVQQWRRLDKMRNKKGET